MPDDRRFLKLRTAAQSAVLWFAEKQNLQIERLRKAPYVGRMLTAYSRYYAIDLRDAASAVVYYATLSLLPVLILGYLGLAWLAQRHPNRFKNADQNLADTLGIPVQDVSSLFDAQAHALLTATTSIIGTIGVLYGAWAWMNTLARGLRSIWGTDDFTEPWRRGARDSLAALASVPVMFAAFAVSGASVGHVINRLHRNGVLSGKTLAALVIATAMLVLGTLLFAVVGQQLCRHLGGAPATSDLWLASATTGLCLAVLSAVAQESVRRTANNPYGIVIDVVGLMIWISIVVRIFLSLAVWTAEEDPATRSTTRLQPEASTS